MKPLLSIIVLCCLTLIVSHQFVISSATLPAASSLEVTYLANEGFLITGGGKKVLIDTLFRQGVEGYAVLSPATRDNLEQGRSPFDQVDVALATHYHADHFAADSVAEFLKANPQAQFFSTNQAARRLSVVASFASFKERVIGALPKEGERLMRSHRGVGVQLLHIHHGRGQPTENLGFLVELGGKKLLHIGDSEAEPKVFKNYALAKERIDVAFIPYWYFFSRGWKDAIREHIRPGHIVLMHLPPQVDEFDEQVRKQGGWNKVWQTIKAEFPNAVCFANELEQKRFN